MNWPGLMNLALEHPETPTEPGIGTKKRVKRVDLEVVEKCFYSINLNSWLPCKYLLLVAFLSKGPILKILY